MTTNRLKARIDRLQPIGTWPMVIHPEPGESEMDVERRAAALGRPVAVMPKPCATAEEWLENHGPSSAGLGNIAGEQEHRL